MPSYLKQDPNELIQVILPYSTKLSDLVKGRDLPLLLKVSSSKYILMYSKESLIRDKEYSVKKRDRIMEKRQKRVGQKLPLR